MIAFVKGVLDSVGDSYIVVENQGIGYRILVPGSVIDKLPAAGSQVKIYTYMHVREDAMQLFGFLTKDSMEMFKLLITVSGVGPKGALGVLTALDIDALRLAILTGDAKTIAKSPGIGAKTAGKVILELRDKIENEDLLPDGADLDTEGGSPEGDRAVAEAVEALEALGYSVSQARVAIAHVQKEGMSVEELLKESLRVIV